MLAWPLLSSMNLLSAFPFSPPSSHLIRSNSIYPNNHHHRSLFCLSVTDSLDSRQNHTWDHFNLDPRTPAVGDD